MPYKDPKKRIEATKRWEQRNPEWRKQYRKAEYQRNKTAGSYSKRRENHAQIREECIRHYSNDTNCCACCGENAIEFLAIDHIDGGGSKHRKEVRKRFPSMYHYLKAEGFPSGYRILCHNCNLARGFYGYCPHDRSPI